MRYSVTQNAFTNALDTDLGARFQVDRDRNRDLGELWENADIFKASWNTA